jgi:hypothetical protein
VVAAGYSIRGADGDRGLSPLTANIGGWYCVNFARDTKLARGNYFIPKAKQESYAQTVPDIQCVGQAFLRRL